MSAPKFANKVQIVGRQIDIYAPTNVAKTFDRVRKQQKAEAEAKAKIRQEQDLKVRKLGVK
jgi:hypothetical protein